MPLSGDVSGRFCFLPHNGTCPKVIEEEEGRRHLLVEIGTVQTVIRQLLAKAFKKERRNLKNLLLEC